MNISEEFKKLIPGVSVVESGETKDYGRFKILEYNRDTRANRKLEKSLLEFNRFIVPIITGEDFAVLDGQNRLKLAKKYGIPVFFIRLNISEKFYPYIIQVLNNSSNRWTIEDFFKKFTRLGNKEYIKLQKFMDFYKLSKLKAVLKILDSYNQKTNERKIFLEPRAGITSYGVYAAKFKDGKLEISPEHHIYIQKIAEEIVQIRELILQNSSSQDEDRDFVFNFKFLVPLSLIVTSHLYNHNHFMTNLEKYKSLIYKCSKQSDYSKMLMKVYNLDLDSKNSYIEW